MHLGFFFCLLNIFYFGRQAVPPSFFVFHDQLFYRLSLNLGCRENLWKTWKWIKSLLGVSKENQKLPGIPIFQVIWFLCVSEPFITVKLFNSAVGHRKLTAVQMLLMHRNCKLCLMGCSWLLLLTSFSSFCIYL